MTRYGSEVRDRLSRKHMYRRIATAVIIAIFAAAGAERRPIGRSTERTRPSPTLVK
jgi:hypothetical protein